MSNTKNFTFHRPQLAINCCDSLEGIGLADSRSGLFLAAPRRTGKSTFLREDLLPAMEQRGWTTIYVDLWADKSKDPAILIGNAIKAKIESFASLISKMAKASRLEKVTVLGALSMNLNSGDSSNSPTLTEALAGLVDAGKAPVAIVIDEAQHALSTETGINSMFALKAARDFLNQGEEQKQKLFIVLTGSNRDKLAHLVLKRTQPFFGSQITRFPLLGKDFTDAYTDSVNAQLALNNQFSKDDMLEAFKLVGHRPEMLRNIVSEIALDTGAKGFSDALKNGAEEIKERMWGEMESEFAVLPEMQRAVLETIITQGKKFIPFSESAMQAYSLFLQNKKVSVTSVQAALDALRDKGLVWRAAYGDYALEDESLAIWYKNRTQQAH